MNLVKRFSSPFVWNKIDHVSLVIFWAKKFALQVSDCLRLFFVHFLLRFFQFLFQNESTINLYLKWNVDVTIAQRWRFLTTGHKFLDIFETYTSQLWDINFHWVIFNTLRCKIFELRSQRVFYIPNTISLVSAFYFLESIVLLDLLSSGKHFVYCTCKPIVQKGISVFSSLNQH